eukprot:9179804-Ditylum_brightwellii.AAC.1
MESGCKGLKGTIGVGASLIILLEVCNELVANINDICELSGGGNCARALKQNDQGGLNILLFHYHFLPVKVGKRQVVTMHCWPWMWMKL